MGLSVTGTRPRLTTEHRAEDSEYRAQGSEYRAQSPERRAQGPGGSRSTLPSWSEGWSQEADREKAAQARPFGISETV